jgi:hypothetical protein
MFIERAVEKNTPPSQRLRAASGEEQIISMLAINISLLTERWTAHFVSHSDYEDKAGQITLVAAD